MKRIQIAPTIETYNRRLWLGGYNIYRNINKKPSSIKEIYLIIYILQVRSWLPGQ
jgi:hypothetical protein